MKCALTLPLNDEFLIDLQNRLVAATSDKDTSRILNTTVVEYFGECNENRARTVALGLKQNIEDDEDSWFGYDPKMMEFLEDADRVTECLSPATNVNETGSTEGKKEEALDDPEAAHALKKRNFITDAYKTSSGAKLIMEQQFLRGVLNSLIFHGKNYTQTSSQLNQGIRDFKEQLFQKIKDYLETKQIYIDKNLYSFGEYTGIFEQIQEQYPEVLSKLQPFATYQQSDEQMTISELDRAAQHYNVSSVQRGTLDAYNAFFILTYFDDLLKLHVPSITIKYSKLYNSLKTINGDKYAIGQFSRIEESWQDQEREVDISEIISLVNKMLIEQMPIYEANSRVKTGELLKQQDFLRIITNLKRMAYTAYGTGDFRANTKKAVSELYGANPPHNFFELIGRLSMDPAKEFPTFFKLLIDERFWRDYENIIGFQYNDRNIIYSMFVGCFEENNNSDEISLLQRYLNDPNPHNKFNYYNFIIQLCTSVEALSLQQYTDRSGAIENTTLRDSQNSARASHLERSVSYNFSSLRPINFKENYIAKYSADRKLNDNYLFFKDDTTEEAQMVEVMNADGSMTKKMQKSAKTRFTFKVGDENVYYTIELHPKNHNFIEVQKYTKNEQGNYNIQKIGTSSNPYTEEDLSNLMPFFNDMLPALELTSKNAPFIQILLQIEKETNKAVDNLLRISSNLFMNAAMVHRLRNMDISSYGNYMSKFEEYYGPIKGKLSFNYHEPKGGLTSLISSDLSPYIKRLSAAYMQLTGVYGDGIVKDSEGKAINQVGTSMLSTKVEQQIIQQNKKPGSASRHFTLWNGLYRGTQFTREFAGSSSTRATQFNVKEHTMASLIYDFLTAYTSEGSKNCSVMPSILSDKSRILKVLFDLNAESPFINEEASEYTTIYKRFRDLTADEWKMLISQELGTYYFKILQNTMSVYDELQKSATLSFPYLETQSDGRRVGQIYTTDIVLDYWNDFAEFNKKVGEISKFLSNKGYNLDVSDVLHQIILNHQTNNPNSKVELAEQIDYVIAKGKLQLNPLIISELSRFADDGGNLLINVQDVSIQDKEYLNFVNFVVDNIAKTDEEKEIVRQNLTDFKYFNRNTEEKLKLYAEQYNKQTKTLFDYTWYLNENGHAVRSISNPYVKVNLAQFLRSFGQDTVLSRKAASSITNTQFWKIKQNDLIKDLLQNNCVIKTTNQAFQDITEADNDTRVKIQRQLQFLKAGSLTGKVGEKWYKSGTGWIGLARLTYQEQQTDDAGQVVMKDGKPVMETRQFIIASESDVRKLSYTKDGRTISYGDEDFNFYDLADGKSSKYTKFELNPCIEMWNTVDFFVSQEFMNSTVGTHLNHPAKKKLNGNPLIEEAERFLAQVKRNVSLSATKHIFTPNLLNGIRGTYKIAVIEDDIANTYNIFGEQSASGAKPFDGATFSCGAIRYLENNSLGANAAGATKKPFVHSYKPKSGTGIIIKTAEFPITNAKINKSPFFRRMNQKMMEGKWTLQDPSHILDISVNYFGEKIPYNIYYYEEATHSYYHVTDIVRLGDGKYQVTRDKIDKFGNVLKYDDTQTYTGIDNNLALWNMFGGSYSMDFEMDQVLGQQVLKNSESSFENLVLAMNSVAEMKGDGKPLHSPKNPPRSQSDLYQNLKYSNIDYVVTAGAIKQGTANLNSRKAYYSDNYKLTTMEVDMYDAGIQLDAEHHADESTLSIMTQVVNALCARGYTWDKSNEVYQAMHDLTINGLRDHIEGLRLYLDVKDGNKEKLLDAVADVIVKGLKNLTDREGNLVQAVAELVVEAAKEGQKVTGNDIIGIVPFSHPAMYKQLMSIISSTFTKQAVKIKFPGVLAVLNPSNGIFKIYGDYMMDDFDPTKTGIPVDNLERRRQIQKTMPNLKPTQLRLGYRYFLTLNGKEHAILLKSPKEYWAIRRDIEYMEASNAKLIEKYKKQRSEGAISEVEYNNLIKNVGITIKEDVVNGRDLAPYQANFQTADGADYNIWDLDVVKDLFAIKELRKILKDYNGSYSTPIGVLKQQNTLPKGFEKWVKEYGLGVYNADQDITDTYTMEQLISNFYTRAGLSAQAGYKTGKKLLMRKLQNTLNNLSKGKGQVEIGRQQLDVKPESVKIYPYELIMPKIYATRFGLQKGDSLHDVMAQGDAFFKQRILQKSASIIKNEDLFDVELKKTDGKHIYILQRGKNDLSDQYARNELLKSELHRNNTIQIEQDGSQWYRTDPVTNERIMQLSSNEDQIWEDEQGNEIIVTNNLRFYLDNESYYDARLSKGCQGRSQYTKQSVLGSFTIIKDQELAEAFKDPDYESEHFQDVLSVFMECDRREVQAYLDRINVNELSGYKLTDAVDTYAEFSMDPAHSTEKVQGAWLQHLDTVAAEQFVAFKESLKILAARIPAQSMQSFMAMQVVGFDDSGTNEAYVNYWQLWLQGSDYDIDKVSLLGAAFTKDGRYIQWSPFFSFRNTQEFEASQTLPYPSGKQITRTVSKKGLELYKYLTQPHILPLFVDSEGRERSRWTAAELKLMGQVLRKVKECNHELQLVDNNYDTLITAIQHVIDKHNTYINSKKDQKKMLMNFITYNMYSVSADLINIIQSQSPIDDQVDEVKGLTEGSKLARQTDTYAPGNVESKMNAIILTLTGKENVGIVASAMKTYEALSYAINKLLREAAITKDPKKLERAMFWTTEGDSKKPGLTVCGQNIKLLANSFVDQDLIGVDSGALKTTLDEVNNDDDAFLLISALLSLATDNAKDPTLSKINANQDIIGLYTAGVAVGIDFNRLVHTIMSETGDYLVSWLTGNVFQGEEKKSLFKVLELVDEGPDMTNLPQEGASLLSKAIKSFSADEIKTEKKNKASTPEEIKAEKQKQAEEEKKEQQDENRANNNDITTLNAKALQRELQKIAERYGNKGILAVFRSATETTRNNYLEIVKIQEEIKAKQEEYSETKDLALHDEIQKLNEKKKDLDISKTTRRALENLMQQWLDYSYKRSRIKGEYIDESGQHYNIWDSFRNELRNAPYQCVKKDQAYLGPDGRVHVLKECTDPSEEDMAAFKADYKLWKEGEKGKEDESWNALVKKVFAEHKSKYAEWVEARKKAIKEKKRSPNRPKQLDIYGYKDAYIRYREELRSGNLNAQKPAYPKPKTSKWWPLIQAKLDEMPLRPQPTNKVFSTEGTAYNPLESIKQLEAINSEFGSLRNLLSLNQGLPNSVGEQVILLRKFKNIIKNRANKLNVSAQEKSAWKDKLGGTLELNIHKFLHDEKYRETAIQIYEQIKAAVNVLSAFYETHHYRGYGTALDCLNNDCKGVSSVFRASMAYSEEVIKGFGYYNNDDIENAINKTTKFFQNILNNMFLQSKNLSITLPVGQRYFDSQGNMQTATTRTTIQLGTPHGNASFKLWFEECVMPNLKKGNFGLVKDGKPQLRSIPSFIQAMEMVEIDRTPSENAFVAYSLPIDMLPHSDSAVAKFKFYKNDLNNLDAYVYYQTLDPDTGATQQVGIPFKNLLFLYNIVAYGMDNTQNAFTSIFEDMMRDGSLPIQEEYNRFISEFDKYQDILVNRDFTIPQLMYWCAPTLTHLLGSTVPYGKYYNPNRMQYQLVRFDPDKDLEHLDQDRQYSELEVSRYQPVAAFTSQFYIRDFVSANTASTMYVNSKTTAVFHDGKLNLLSYNGNTYKMSDLIEHSKSVAPDGAALQESDLVIPLETRIIDGKKVRVPSRKYVEAIIDEIFNPCP